jgi:hypothetical protein
VTSWYLGKPGALQAIRPPARDYSRTADDAPNVVELLNGRAVQRRPRALGTYTYQWNYLERPDWSLIKAIASGQYGPGPYALVDGSTANYLSPAQASGQLAGWHSDFATLTPATDSYPHTQSVQYAPTTTGTDAQTHSLSAAEVSLGGTWRSYFTVPAGATAIDVTAVVGAGFNHLYLNNAAGSSVADSFTTSLHYAGTIAAGQWSVDVVGTTPTQMSRMTTVTLPAAGLAPLSPVHSVFGGFPVPAGTSWTFSADVWVSANTAAKAGMDWRNGVSSLTTFTASATLVGGQYTRVSVTDTAPSNATTVVPTLYIPAGTTAFVTRAQLSMDPGATWYPGEGLPAVSVTQLQESVPLYDKRTVQLTLTEVA